MPLATAKIIIGDPNRRNGLFHAQKVLWENGLRPMNSGGRDEWKIDQFGKYFIHVKREDE